MAGCLLGASDPREKGNAAVATIYKVHYDNVPVDVEPGLTDLDGTTEEVYRGPHASKA
jgi:hypothetical protein